MRFDDWSGKQYGRLIYQWPVGRNKFQQVVWLAACECGTLVYVQKRQAESCGCLQRERTSIANSALKSEQQKQKQSAAMSVKNTRHICPVCGKDFLGTKYQRFCSVHPCQKRYFDSGTHRAKARANGGKIEAVAFWKVYERDGGKCQVCGDAAPRELRGNPHEDAAPTLGHIIPLSQGGDHTYANVQLEHLGCNLEKGNRLPEGAVVARINPDPRTREQKISDSSKRQWADPEKRAILLESFRNRNNGPHPPQSAAMKAAWARGAYESRNSDPED